MTTNSISVNQANHEEIITGAETVLNGQVGGHGDTHTLMAQQVQAGNKAQNEGKPESELRAAARRHGYTLKELAALMGASYSHLCSVANGHRPWTPELREKVKAALGEVPGQGVVYRQGGVVQGESSFIRERAREKGMSLKDLAVVVGMSYRYMTQVARGQRNMSPSMQVRVESALGGPVEIAPAVCANRQDSIPSGGSNFIRERARELGLSMGELADLVGVSRGFMSDVARGRRNLSPRMQARVEAVLDAPVKVEAVPTPTVDPRALWDRMDAHGISQNETARRAGISPSLLSQIMNGLRTPSGGVLRRLYNVLFAPSSEELVAPVELKVMGWKKGTRNGLVVKGAGGPGGETIRTGGRVPWGAEVEFAYTSGYDSRGRVSVNHLMDERGYGVMLNKPEQYDA
ncbi:MAG: helix-turn-helix domain-containing protein [Chloroflexi bacterium]|nr:helix-turn-helix domain-containing protein [Chloroflexota bacterium]MYE38913.1 helix-turn-helix domain-containing protein [Chloroflexota bacterium]